MIQPKLNTQMHFSRHFASSLDEVELVCRDLRMWLLSQGLNQHQFRIELILRECLNNAVLHGNRKQPGLHVEFEVRHRLSWIWARVRDEGSGFDWRARNNESEPCKDKPNGRGLAIAYLRAEQVRFNDSGNQIFLLFRIKSRK